MTVRALLVSLAVLSALLAPAGAGGQTIQSLQDQIRRAQDDIRASNQLLDKNRKEQKMTLTQLKIIASQIESRRQVIASLEGQITLLNKDITRKSDNIVSLKSQLDTLKKEYAGMVRVAYKNYKINNFALFVFSAGDFNDITRRIAFIERYNVSRERKAQQIDSLSKSLSAKVVELNVQKAALDKTRSARGRELTTLAGDQKTFQSSAAKLKASESKLATTVRARQAQIDQAQAQIRRIMAEEARKSKSVKRTPEEEQRITELTGRFDQNMGKLPFPVSGGVIIDRYGRHQSQIEKNVMVNNPGINIATPPGATVRCVFDGEVRRVVFYPTTGNVVLVNHGDYNTIYSNLASVAVKPGDKVSLNQTLGYISDSGDPDQCRLHFEMWRGMATLDPGLWLRQ